MIIPKLYGSENFNDLLRIRRTCGIRIIGLLSYKYLYGADNDEHTKIEKQINKLQDVIYATSIKLVHGNEEKGLHEYLVYMKWLDKKYNTIDNLVNG